jgi:hypothetical protein
MLAPPPGETFDGRREKKVPAKAAADGNAPEQVPLLTSRSPEQAGVDAPKCSNVRLFLEVMSGHDRNTVHIHPMIMVPESFRKRGSETLPVNWAGDRHSADVY